MVEQETTFVDLFMHVPFIGWVLLQPQSWVCFIYSKSFRSGLHEGAKVKFMNAVNKIAVMNAVYQSKLHSC